jgi:uncharacterized damage-inducible protein DinB
MKLTSIISEQLKTEGELTKRALEQVPSGKADWKPHPKSMPLGQLAQMVAVMPSWIAMILNQDELDIKPKAATAGNGAHKTPDSAPALVKALDKAVSEASKAVEGADDKHLQTPWKLLEGGKVVDEKSRFQFIMENFKHLAHHRGQLTVYLRMNDAKVPAIYGPSADDHRF